MLPFGGTRLRVREISIISYNRMRTYSYLKIKVQGKSKEIRSFPRVPQERVQVELKLCKLPPELVPLTTTAKFKLT